MRVHRSCLSLPSLFEVLFLPHPLPLLPARWQFAGARTQTGRQSDRQTDRHTHIIPRDLTQSTTIHPYLVCMYVWRTTCLIPPHSHSRARARARERESERESAHEEPMWIHSMCLCVNEVARIYDMHQIGCLYYAQM